MITFKQFITEANENVTLTGVSTLKDLKDPKTGKYYTGVVDVTADVFLSSKSFTKLPVQFGTVSGDFRCNDGKLTVLEGLPRETGGTFHIGGNQLISLEGIHKIVKRIDGSFICYNNPIRAGGIGLVLIEGLTPAAAPWMKRDSDFPASKIINKYLGQGKKGLLLCQDWSAELSGY